MVGTKSRLLRKAWIGALAVTVAVLVAIVAGAMNGDSTNTSGPVATGRAEPVAGLPEAQQEFDWTEALSSQLEDLDVPPPPTILGFLTGGVLPGYNSRWSIDKAELSLAAPGDPLVESQESSQAALPSAWMESELSSEPFSVTGQPADSLVLPFGR